MTRLTHLAGRETANDLRARLQLYHEWLALNRVACDRGVAVNEPYPPTAATPRGELAAMISRLQTALATPAETGAEE
jgi:hypothetical protein